jgi:uncharacterized protein
LSALVWQDIFTAVALLLVFEGIMPFLNPAQFRKTLLAALKMNDSTLRVIGLGSMLGGIVLLYVVR